MSKRAPFNATTAAFAAGYNKASTEAAKDLDGRRREVDRLKAENERQEDENFRLEVEIGRLTAVCAVKDVEIKRLRAALKRPPFAA